MGQGTARNNACRTADAIRKGDEMNNTDRILEHLETGNSITSLEAFYNYGVTRLAASICLLRKAGYQVEDKRIPVVNRYGKTVYVKEYRLAEEANGI